MKTERPAGSTWVSFTTTRPVAGESSVTSGRPSTASAAANGSLVQQVDFRSSSCESTGRPTPAAASRVKPLSTPTVGSVVSAVLVSVSAMSDALGDGATTAVVRPGGGQVSSAVQYGEGPCT
jgi:hypothetical protein